MLNFIRIRNYGRRLIINQFFFLTIFNVNEALEVGRAGHYRGGARAVHGRLDRGISRTRPNICRSPAIRGRIHSSRATLEPVYEDYPTLVYVSLSTLYI